MIAISVWPFGYYTYSKTYLHLKERMSCVVKKLLAETVAYVFNHIPILDIQNYMGCSCSYNRGRDK